MDGFDGWLVDWQTGGRTIGWTDARMADGRLDGPTDESRTHPRKKEKNQFSSTVCHDLTLRHPVRSGGVQKAELLQSPRYPAPPRHPPGCSE